MLNIKNHLSKTHRGHRPYRFEEKWLHDGESKIIIIHAWHDEVPIQSNWKRLQEKLLQCQTYLTSWATTKQRDTVKEINEKSETL